MADPVNAASRRLRAALAAVLVRDNAPGAARPSRRRSCWITLAAVSLLTELDAFYTEHRRCGVLDGGVEGVPDLLRYAVKRVNRSRC